MATPFTANVAADGGVDNHLNTQAASLFNPSTGSGAGHIAYDGQDYIDAGWQSSTDAKRAEITDYVRMRLGDGIVDVELEKEHYEMAINQALIKYRQRAQNSVEESYCHLQLLPETQEYILPKEVQTVRAIYRRGIGSVTGTTASQFEPFASGYLNTYMLVAGRVGGLTNYEMFASYQKLAMTMFGGFMNFTFNPATKKLVVVRKMPNQGINPPLDQQESVLLWIYNNKPDQMIFNDTYVYPWIQEYAYSFSKMLLGQAYSKFSQIAGPQGGASLNGAAMVQEAKDEMVKLEEDIRTYAEGSQPLTWIVG